MNTYLTSVIENVKKKHGNEPEFVLPALAYSNQTAGNNAPAVGYSTVYPVSMFLRILTAQLLILILAS